MLHTQGTKYATLMEQSRLHTWNKVCYIYMAQSIATYTWNKVCYTYMEQSMLYIHRAKCATYT